SHVFVFFWRFALRALDHLRAAFEHLRIHVTQRDIFGLVFQREDIFDVRTALAVKTDRANANAAVRAKHLAGSHRAPNEHGGSGLAEKLSSSQFHGVMWVACSADSGPGGQGVQGSKFVKRDRNGSKRETLCVMHS